jgi:hypothetical protein
MRQMSPARLMPQMSQMSLIRQMGQNGVCAPPLHDNGGIALPAGGPGL